MRNQITYTDLLLLSNWNSVFELPERNAIVADTGLKNLQTARNWYSTPVVNWHLGQSVFLSSLPTISFTQMQNLGTSLTASSIPENQVMADTQLVLIDELNPEQSTINTLISMTNLYTQNKHIPKKLTSLEAFDEAFKFLEKSEKKWQNSLKREADVFSWINSDLHDIRKNSRNRSDQTR